MGLLSTLELHRICHGGVAHVTLNPEGPGAVRIHMVPPHWRLWHPAGFVVILNGYYILPLGYSWAILLYKLIDELQATDGQPMDQEEMDDCIERAVRATARLFPLTSRKLLRSDLRELLDTLFAVARNGTVESDELQPLSLRGYAPNMNAPHRMDLLVSSMTDSEGNWQCNLRCRHCYAAGQPQAGCKELTTEQWKDVIDRLHSANIPMLTFTGGEPTLRPDLPELVAHAHRFVTRLNTNGIRLTPALCEALRQASLDSLQITLYSHDESVHNRLVGAGTEGGWAESVAGLQNAAAAGLDLSVNTPLCRDNADYTETLRWLHGLGVRFVSCSGLIETGKAADGAVGTQLSTDEMDKLLADAAAFCTEHGMELSFTSPGRAGPAQLRGLGLTVPGCGACLSNMAISPDGTVVPCQSWLGSDAGLGNILTDNWRDIWQADACRQLRLMSCEEALACPLRSRKEVPDGEKS